MTNAKTACIVALIASTVFGVLTTGPSKEMIKKK
jgi:hypothetical protein